MRVPTLSLFLFLTAAGIAVAQPAEPRTPNAPQQPRTPSAPQPPQPRTQGATPQAAPAPPPAAPAERRQYQPINVKVDVTITDQRGGAQALKKTVSVVTSDGNSGFIRSTATYVRLGAVPLNVDAEPVLLADGKIRLRVNLQYELPAPPTELNDSERNVAGQLTKTQIHENLALVLENGKSIVASQSADPVGDRQVTIEVKATVLR